MTTDALYSFHLPRGLLRAIALFQSKDRPTLACASIEIRANGMRHEIQITATDGRRLATHQMEICNTTLWGELPPAEQITADLSGCLKLPKVSGDFGDEIIVEVFAKHIEFAAESMRYHTRRLEQGDGSVQFPDWRQVIPARQPESVTQIAVNFELLADFGKAAKWLTQAETPIVALRTFGEEMPIAVIFPSHREFFGIIMPVKFENPETVPEWLRDTQAATTTNPES